MIELFGLLLGGAITAVVIYSAWFVVSLIMSLFMPEPKAKRVAVGMVLFGILYHVI